MTQLVSEVAEAAEAAEALAATCCRCQNDPGRARIEGPGLMLEQQAAQAMAVAVHELTTNAVKYGALSTPRGASASSGHAIRSSGIDT